MPAMTNVFPVGISRLYKFITIVITNILEYPFIYQYLPHG